MSVVFGNGTFNLNGGTVIADEFNLTIEEAFNASGTAGVLIVNTLTGFGDDLSFPGSFYLGHAGRCRYEQVFSIGTGQSLTTGYLGIGFDATGTFTQTGGTNTVLVIYVGYLPGW